MKEGTVVVTNQRRGMFVVQIDEGDFVVFELLTGIDIAIGDRIAGDLDALGREELRHLGQAQRFDAYGQSGPSSLVACKHLVGN